MNLEPNQFLLIIIQLKGSIDKTPMGRLANPEEVADGIVFLSSNRASYITGTTLTVSDSIVKQRTDLLMAVLDRWRVRCSVMQTPRLSP